MANTTVVALYDGRESAERAVNDLVAEGFDRDRMSLVAGKSAVIAPDVGPHEEIGSGATAGAGAAIGAAGGFLAGVAALAIPGIGPVLAAGPLATALIGATAGAATGGLIVGLRHIGIGEHEAEYYEQAVRRGGVLVSVHAGERAEAAADILDRNGAVDVAERAATWRESGWRPRIESGVETPLRGLDDLTARAEMDDTEQTGRTRSRGSGARVFVW